MDISLPASRSTPDDFLGDWRIHEMEVWAADMLDLETEAHIKLTDDGSGVIEFVAVKGWLDCRFGELEGQALVEFSWEGKDDRRNACGRGWAVLVGGQLEGRIFIHHGDDSWFKAERR